MSTELQSTPSGSKDSAGEIQDLTVDKIASTVVNNTMNHMVPVVFLDDIHETKNLKEFVRYIAVSYTHLTLPTSDLV